MYCWYLYVVGSQVVDWSYEGISQLEVRGKGVNLAVLIGFSGAVMTVSKTLLYCECSLSKTEWIHVLTFPRVQRSFLRL